MAVAEASFKTEKDSISFGFILASTPLDPPAVPDIGSPSITISGSFDALREDPPLILI